jgi:hypothetical protein
MGANPHLNWRIQVRGCTYCNRFCSSIGAWAFHIYFTIGGRGSGHLLKQLDGRAREAFRASCRHSAARWLNSLFSDIRIQARVTRLRTTRLQEMIALRGCVQGRSSERQRSEPGSKTVTRDIWTGIGLGILSNGCERFGSPLDVRAGVRARHGVLDK